MAYRNTILTNTDPIIAMTKGLNIVLRQIDSAIIRQVLNDHAFPIIRLRVLSATSAEVNGEGTGQNQGRNIWFTDLTDLADPVVQANVDSQIDTFLMGNPLLQDGIYSIAARLAGSFLTSSGFAQIKPQADYSKELEDSAKRDLEKLIRTPFFTEAARALQETTLKERGIPRIYVAADINDDIATYNSSTNLGTAYTGAQVPGKAMLFIGWGPTDVVEYTFPAGTTPSQILAGLTQAWRLAQQAKQLADEPFLNVVVGPDEGRPVIGTRLTDYKTYPGGTAAGTYAPAVTVNMGFLQLTPYIHDKVVDFLNIELSLRHETVENSGVFDAPGVPGILFGIEPIYSALTRQGPHSIIVDVKTGQQEQSLKTTENKTISDTFYFGVAVAGEAAAATATVAGTVADGDEFEVTIGSDTYSHTAGGSATPTSVATALASAITTGALFAASAEAGVLTVESLQANSSENGVTFAVDTTSLTATFTTGFSQLDDGRDDNTLTTSGTLQYRFGEMIDPLNPVPGTVARTRSIAVTRGQTVLQVVMAIAQDMASFSATSRCLGAVRAPTRFKIAGTPFNAPGLTIVPYTRDVNHYNVVFDMLAVPQDLLFAPLPYDLLPTPSDVLFDDFPKSLIVPAKFLNSAGGGGTTTQQSLTATNIGEVKNASHVVTKPMARAISDVRRLLNE